MIKILKFNGFNKFEINKDTKSNLKFKRTIILAKNNLKMNNFFEKFKDKHKNKRVFIIGNGPSLKDTNLNLLKNEISIAMNRVSLIYEKNKDWKPTYYLFTSTNVVSKDWSKEWKDLVIESIKVNKTTSFISEQFKEIIDPQNQFERVYWMKMLQKLNQD